MTITLNYKQYIDLLGSIGELQGMVKGLLMYSAIPLDVKEGCGNRLTTINQQVATFLESPKDLSHEECIH